MDITFLNSRFLSGVECKLQIPHCESVIFNIWVQASSEWLHWFIYWYLSSFYSFCPSCPSLSVFHLLSVLHDIMYCCKRFSFFSVFHYPYLRPLLSIHTFGLTPYQSPCGFTARIHGFAAKTARARNPQATQASQQLFTEVEVNIHHFHRQWGE